MGLCIAPTWERLLIVDVVGELCVEVLHGGIVVGGLVEEHVRPDRKEVGTQFLKGIGVQSWALSVFFNLFNNKK